MSAVVTNLDEALERIEAQLPESAYVRECRACLEEKPLEAFRKHPHKSLGREGTCRACEAKSRRSANSNTLGVASSSSLRGMSPQQEAARKALFRKSGRCVCGKLAVEHPVIGCPGFFERGL